MNIILLSGGSGKRLWPLSNDVRSKQFLKLFKDTQGDYESMLQRVYRQITEADPEATVTLATSRNQASAIHSQLGEKVNICVEPCRRDTFPAILLAAAYLHDQQGVGLDEHVVICPVDHYVDNSFYQCVSHLDDYMTDDNCHITLIGIEPDAPSDKYGYIIPESSEAVSRVRFFREKPDIATAKEYLKQHALWNAGVFAMRLGYLLDKGHSLIDFTDYQDLFDKYDRLSKISFDYAVVENEPSIQVVRYLGSWKDVGTWNMMADVMTENIKGNAIMDETSVRTHIINELNIPILCVGAKDMVIAASGDGILVTDREQSAHIKPQVEKIITNVHFAEKSWGTFSMIDAQPGSITVKISMRAGEHMSLHSHRFRSEVWTIISGSGTAIVDGRRVDVTVGDVITIPSEAKHTLLAVSDLNVIEVQTGYITVSDKEKYPFDDEE